MSKHLNVLQNLINNLSTRERVLVLLGVLAVVYMLWESFLIAPMQKTSKSLANEHSMLKGQITDLETRRIIASGQLKNSKRKKLAKEIEQIETRIKEFDDVIRERLQGRVAPEHMAALLNDVLQKNDQLTLLSIKNLPAVPFGKKADKDNTGKQQELIDPQLVGIFLHAMELELQGSYLDILSYLQTLETMQWKIFWDQVKLQTLEYPKVKVHIKVHTFSLNEGWLSV